MADLADERAVVHYDQLGNGRSTHYPDRGAEFWTPELFVRELHNLVEALGIADHHVLGQSWGGFLAQEYALTQPAGLRSLVLADTAASWADFATEAGKLREQLPADVQATLAQARGGGHVDDPEYMQACLAFYDRHLCRVPWPPELSKTFEYLDEDPTVYRTMNGPSEFHIIGSCKDWQVKDRLHEIRVPTLHGLGPPRRGDAGAAGDAARRDRRLGVGVLRGVLAHAAHRGALSATCRSSAIG